MTEIKCFDIKATFRKMLALLDSMMIREHT